MKRRPRSSLVLALVAASLALSSCILDGGWATTPIEPAPPGTDAAFVDVSCPTDNFCMAVGNTEVVTHTRPVTPFVQVWDGTSWSSLAFTPFASATTLGHEARSVSCGTPTSCAVGYTWFSDEGEDQDAFAIWTGASWTAVPALSSQAPIANHDCAPDGSCVFDVYDWGVVLWDGSTFTQDGLTFWASPAQMVCESMTSCRGLSGASSLTWDGTAWSTVDDLPVPSTIWTGLACSSPTSCLAVGHTWSGESTPRSIRFDGTSWTEVALPISGADRLRSLSCSSTISCFAVGTIAGDTSTADQEVALAWNGGQWFRAPDPVTAPDGSLAAVSCPPGGTTCIAVGSATVDGTTVPIASRYDWVDAPVA